MWDYFFGLGAKIVGYFGDLTRTQWMIVLGAMVAVGFVCMRGFAGRGRI